jgi:hypothetical protein
VYSYSNSVDTKLLLAERLAYAAGQGRETQNCATASLKYAATQLGRAPLASELAQMVGSDGQTTMRDLKRCAQSLGLYCRAVQADMATLEGLSGCKAILHIPGQDHFVVLDRVDDRYAWIVDLADDRFYSRKDRGLVAREWSGIALLVSNQPIRGQFTEVTDDALRNITGGAGWSCTALIQQEEIIMCEPADSYGFACYGYFQWYFQRWGCEPAQSGNCVDGILARMAGTDCYTDPLYGCQVTGVWDWYGMSACN